jgi:hypothetical protein
MAKRAIVSFASVLSKLRKYGLLLLTDPKLPSVAGLVCGGPVRGSWWAHSQAHAIFKIDCLLDDHPDVLVIKLVSGKVTFVHRSLWASVLAIGTAREPWQVKDLTLASELLLDRLNKSGELRTDEKRTKSGAKGPVVAACAPELEEKLLIYAEEIHTVSGAHAKRLETWAHWKQRTGFSPKLPTPEQARKKLDLVLAKLNKQFDTDGTLPWQQT